MSQNSILFVMLSFTGSKRKRSKYGYSKCNIDLAYKRLWTYPNLCKNEKENKAQHDKMEM